MTSFRSASFALLALLSIPVVVACGAEPSVKRGASNLDTCVANQKLRCICGIEEGEQTCDEDNKLSECDCSKGGKKNGSSLEEGPIPATENPTTTTPTPDAGASLGALCSDLSKCCDELRVAGFTGSESQCKRVVADRNETSCSLAHQTFRTPDESDFVCR